MKFEEYIYTRPDLEEIEAKFNKAIMDFSKANSVEEQYIIIDDINAVRRHFSTMGALCSVRSALDVNDKYYEEEQKYFDENSPRYAGFEHTFGSEILKSKFRNTLKEKYFPQYFALLEAAQKVFKPEIIDDLIEENRLATEYRKLIAGASITFDGKVNNLSQMGPYLIDVNRNIRRDAETTIAAFFSANEDVIDDIYDRLVRVRDKMAKTLGYRDFVELGYIRLGRTDYTYNDVASYRGQVERDLVPLVSEMVADKMKRLGIHNPKSYDLGLDFKSGNPRPFGTPWELIEKAQKMYHELSADTGAFIDFMIERRLLDVETRAGKSGGGFSTYLFDYRSPFIFANFNGTSGDVNVLTHEAGHAFQFYSSRHFQVMEYLVPTYEAAEIHSMGMEFFTWPWMELFFLEDADRYRYKHLIGTLEFIPYGVLIDEFQHEVYRYPDLTPDERKKVFRRLEKKYLPYKEYENAFFNKGTYWFRQSHVFSLPFYYIDYTLAQVCAHQFWIMDRENHEDAWSRYLRLCKLGGSKPFLELCENVGLKNPFEPGTIKSIAVKVNEYLKTVDSSEFV